MAWDIWGWKAKIWCWKEDRRGLIVGFIPQRALESMERTLDCRILKAIGDVGSFAF